jgi:hypothetical protein
MTEAISEAFVRKEEEKIVEDCRPVQRSERINIISFDEVDKESKCREKARDFLRQIFQQKDNSKIYYEESAIGLRIERWTKEAKEIKKSENLEIFRKKIIKEIEDDNLI